MASCPHGFPQGQCLICSTLARSQGATQVAEKQPNPHGTPDGVAAALSPLPTEGIKVAGNGGAQLSRRHARHYVVTALLVVVVGLLAWGLFQGVLSLALHIAEYVAVGLLSGWLGYRAGHWRARHERKGR